MSILFIGQLKYTLVVNNGKCRSFGVFGVWYLSFFLTDRLSLVDAICPFFLRFGDIGSIVVFLADQFMEQVDGLILGFSKFNLRKLPSGQL